MTQDEEFRPVRDIDADVDVEPAEQAHLDRQAQNRATQDDAANYPAMLAALHMAELGCTLLPVQTHKKDPLLGKKWAETTRAYPQTFLRNPGTRNYGLLPPPGCVILDVDALAPELMAHLSEALGPLPETRVHSSPNGQHWFFSWPEDLPRPKGPWWGKVVARWPFGDEGQGYVVGPGSEVEQEDGSVKAYSVLLDSPIAELPRLWAESVLAWRPPVGFKAPDGVGDWSEVDGPSYELPESVGEGGRYHSIVQYTAHLYNYGLTRDEMWLRVRDDLLPRWQKPKRDDEVRGDFLRATKQMESRLGPRAHNPLPGEIVGGSLLDPAFVAPTHHAPTVLPPLDTTAYPQVEDHGPRPEDTQPSDIPFIEVSGALKARLSSMAPQQWLFKGLLPQGLNVLGGHPKSGKSLALLQMQATFVTGGTFLGHDMTATGHRVALYVTEEGSRYEMLARLSRLETAFPGLDATGRYRVAYLKQVLFDRPHLDGIAAVLADIASEFSAMPGPLHVWMAFDPLRDFMPGGADENEAKHIKAVKDWCRSLLTAFPFLTITLVHHRRKNASGDTGLELSGSGALYAAVDSTLLWRADKKDEVDADDEGELFTRRPLRGTYNSETKSEEPIGGKWVFDGTLMVPDSERRQDSTGRSMAGETRASVAELLVAAGLAGLSVPELASLAELSLDAARNALRRLVETGFATVVEGGIGRGAAKRYYRRGYDPANSPDGLVPPDGDEDDDLPSDPLHGFVS